MAISKPIFSDGLGLGAAERAELEARYLEA